MTDFKDHPGKQFTPTYGVYLMYVDKGEGFFLFCPYCFNKTQWKVQNEPPKYCTECGKALRTRLAVPKEGE